MQQYGTCLEGSNGKNTVSAHDFELRTRSIQIASKQTPDNDDPTRLRYNREEENIEDHACGSNYF